MTTDNPHLTRLVQERLSELGCEPGKIDGEWGPKTQGAFDRYVATLNKPSASSSAPVVGQVDERSETNIATLLPEVRPLARALVQRAADAGITIKVISGMRTYAEQDALYAQGRTAPGSIVTNARGGYSNHNFGTAFDVGIFRGGAYVPESPGYKNVGLIGKSIGLEWGGDWQSLRDEPHFELRPKWAASMTSSQILAEFRRRKAAGTPLLA